MGCLGDNASLHGKNLGILTSRYPGWIFSCRACTWDPIYKCIFIVGVTKEELNNQLLEVEYFID